MSDQTYNGWTNYETWVWNLWIDNDQGWQETTREAAERIYRDAEPSYDRQTKAEAAYIDLADYLKADCEEMQEIRDMEVSGPFADLLGAAIGRIDWYEIAQHWIDDLDTAAIDAELADDDEQE